MDLQHRFTGKVVKIGLKISKSIVQSKNIIINVLMKTCFEIDHKFSDGKLSDDGNDMYLYSHHPSGHLWLVGRTLKTWSLRLNYLSYMKTLLDKNKKGKYGPPILGSLGHMMCPTDRKQKEEDALEMEIDIPYPKWEYLQSKKGEDEIWLKDDIFDFVCIP